MKRTGVWALSLVILSAFVFEACASGEIVDSNSAKGEESPLPEDSKDDSFRKPTEHGTLTFGIVAQGELTEESRYHVWDFTLTGDASVTLRTEPVTANLDTVMYVYSRKPGEPNWGRYDARNDDFDGNIWSQITVAGEALEYRVLIKGYKHNLRGTFALHSTCDGAGCPTTGGSGDDVHTMPAGGDLNASCFERIDGILHSGVMSQDGYGISYEKERGALSGAALKAVDFYAEYWQDIGYWEDMNWDGEGHDLNVGLTLVEDGALVEVDAGGDEDSLTFLFDGTETLLAYYHSEQSPTIAFFCTADGSAAVSEPEEFCFGAWMNYAPHNDDDAGDLEGYTTIKEVSDSDELDKMVGTAVMWYANDAEVEEDVQIRYQGVRWESTEWGAGAIVTLSADGAKTFTYELGSSDYDTWLFLSTDQDGVSRFICDES